VNGTEPADITLGNGVQLEQSSNVCHTKPPSVSRSLNSSCPATTLPPSSTNNSSITPAPGDGTGMDVYNSISNLHTFTQQLSMAIPQCAMCHNMNKKYKRNERCCHRFSQLHSTFLQKYQNQTRFSSEVKNDATNCGKSCAQVKYRSTATVGTEAMLVKAPLCQTRIILRMDDTRSTKQLMYGVLNNVTIWQLHITLEST